ncbi:hypothetical protein IJI00_00185 [Candidatus Saccharibacteria bacterium]|nr:hypothetical protein [Candidatus Saccharibacteria bacterium]
MQPNQAMPQIPQRPAQPVPPMRPAQPTQPFQTTQPVQPVQPVQPAQPATQPVAPADPMMSEPVEVATMSEQMDEILSEPLPVEQFAPADVAVETQAPKKKNTTMIVAMVCCAVLAVAGIAFGAFMMIQRNNDIAAYDKKIADLRKTNSELSATLAETEELTGEEALAMLRESAAVNSLGFDVAYANVFAKYVGDEDMVAYWVKYMPTNVSEGVATANNVIFEQDENGEWSFSLPGFTDEDSAKIISDYELIDPLGIYEEVVEDTEEEVIVE